jgi:hypothetical protein
MNVFWGWKDHFCTIPAIGVAQTQHLGRRLGAKRLSSYEPVGSFDTCGCYRVSSTFGRTHVIGPFEIPSLRPTMYTVLTLLLLLPRCMLCWSAFPIVTGFGYSCQDRVRENGSRHE